MVFQDQEQDRMHDYIIRKHLDRKQGSMSVGVPVEHGSHLEEYKLGDLGIRGMNPNRTEETETDENKTGARRRDSLGYCCSYGSRTRELLCYVPATTRLD